MATFYVQQQQQQHLQKQQQQQQQQRGQGTEQNRQPEIIVDISSAIEIQVKERLCDIDAFCKKNHPGE